MRESKLLVALIFILLSACTDPMDVDPQWIINPNELKIITQEHKRTYVLFWTDWCSGSKLTRDHLFIPFADTIHRSGLDMAVILIAADENIPLDTIKKQRDRGLNAFYLQAPGGSPFLHRRAIKNFIQEALPGNDLETVSGMFFPIPVKLVIDQDQKILNRSSREVPAPWEE